MSVWPSVCGCKKKNGFMSVWVCVCVCVCVTVGKDTSESLATFRKGRGVKGGFGVYLSVWDDVWLTECVWV